VIEVVGYGALWLKTRGKKGAYTQSGDSNHILTEFVYGTVPVYTT
jgi:hypothetical protein